MKCTGADGAEASMEEENIHGRYISEKDMAPHQNVDKYGFIVENCTSALSEQMCTHLERRWSFLIEACGTKTKRLKISILKQHMLERGIPLSFKNKVWPLFVQGSSVTDCDAQTFKNHIYWPCKYEYQIHVDVQRTFRKHILYNKIYGIGQSQLFYLLIAISNSNLNIGYCQGMNDICGVLLMYFTTEESFFIFKRLVERDSLCSLFKNFAKVPEILKKQNKVLLHVIPQIYDHILENGVDLSICVVPWYLTWFSRFEIRLTLRLWDFLFFYGFNVFLYFTPAFLKLVEREIFSKTGESLMNFLGGLEKIEFDEDMVIGLGCKYMSEMRGRYLDVV